MNIYIPFIRWIFVPTNICVSAIANRAICLALHELDADNAAHVSRYLRHMHHFRTFDLKTKSTVAWGARSRKLAQGPWQRDATESRSKFRGTRTTPRVKGYQVKYLCASEIQRRSQQASSPSFSLSNASLIQNHLSLMLKLLINLS